MIRKPSERETSRATPRFGLAALILLMTAFALVFAGFRHLNAPPAIYLFFGMLGFATGLAQMRWGAMPRMASIGAGALLLPATLIFTALFFRPRRRWAFWMDEMAWSLGMGVFLGAVAGYVTGTVVAGVFLVSERLERSTSPGEGHDQGA